MGQAESNIDDVGPGHSVEPEVEVSRRRSAYLNSLGIQKDGKPIPFAPQPSQIMEAPGRMEHTSSNPQEPNESLDLVDGTNEEEYNMNMFGTRSQDDFRGKFLRKLSYSKVWVPQAQRPPKHQTVIIFDWDDTLLCTSFLNLRPDATLPANVERLLREIEGAGRRLLEMAMRLGHTFIITNAMNGWVEYSAAKWVPELLPVLQKVRVISARTRFEPQFPREVNKWKIQAFLEVQRQLDSQIITNLISLGDSNFEMDAVHVMGQEFSQALVKTIKFRENPTPEELWKQLELVAQKFERIVENARNLKIGLERKTVGQQQQQQPQQQDEPSA